MTAAVEQIQKGIDMALERAKMLMENIAKIRELLKENERDVTSLADGVISSLEGAKENVKRIKDLDLISRKIDKIVEVITTVSIQTNMLAVNGAIEAARAGVYGKGFVVVATDIRNLAHESAENADKIKDLVKAVQDQIEVVKGDLEEIIDQASGEVAKTEEVIKDLKRIDVEITGVEEGAKEILADAEQIATAIDQVRKGVEQIAAAAQEAQQATSEAAAAAKQQAQGADELAAAIEEIASLADELQSGR